MLWFRHDSRANRDAKIEKLMMKYGSDGYALYWLCLELITDRVDANNLTFELEHDAETLGARLKIDTLRVEEIMRWMVNESLFESHDDIVTCFKLAKRLDNSLLRTPHLVKIQQNIRNDSEAFGSLRSRGEENRREERRIEEKETFLTKATEKNRFVRPTLQEVVDYCSERGNQVMASTFVDFYESKGWKIGKESMKDWKAAVRTWEKRNVTNDQRDLTPEEATARALKANGIIQ